MLKHLQRAFENARVYSFFAHVSPNTSLVARSGLKASAIPITAVGSRSRSQFFFVACAAVFIFFVFGYTYLGAPHWLRIDSDSPSYLQPTLWGSYSDGRNSGYATFLRGVHVLMGLGRLDEVQLALELFGFAIAVGMLAYAYGAWISAGIVLLLFSYVGVFSYYSSQILTEPLYIFGFSLFALGLAAGVRRPAWGLFALTGIGLAAAVLAKSVGIVFLAPSLLALRFLPNQVRAKAAALIMLPALSIYLIMCVHGYYRFGEFRPEAISGVQLTGIAASFLEPASSNDELATVIQEAAKPLLEKRPADLRHIRSVDDLNRYVDYVTREFNQVLWLAIYPAAVKQTNNAPFHVINRKLYKIGMRSVRAHPDLYFLNVLANFYGIWREMGMVCGPDDTRDSCHNGWFSPDIISMGKVIRLQHGEFQWPNIIDFTNTHSPTLGLTKLPSSEELASAVAAQNSVPTMGLRPLYELIDGFRTLTIAIGVGALVLSTLFLLPLRYISALAPSIVLSLVLNAHVAGHSLLGGYADLRYAAVLIPIVIGFLFCIAKDIGGLSFFQRLIVWVAEPQGERASPRNSSR